MQGCLPVSRGPSSAALRPWGVVNPPLPAALASGILYWFPRDKTELPSPRSLQKGEASSVPVMAVEWGVQASSERGGPAPCLGSSGRRWTRALPPTGGNARVHSPLGSRSAMQGAGRVRGEARRPLSVWGGHTRRVNTASSVGDGL